MTFVVHSEFEGGVSSAAAAIPRSDGTPTSAAVVLFGPAKSPHGKMIERVAPLVVPCRERDREPDAARWVEPYFHKRCVPVAQWQRRP